MAERSERHFEEFDFSGDPQAQQLTSEMSLIRPLSSDEGYAASPLSPSSGGSRVFPASSTESELETRISTIESYLSHLLGTVAGVVKLTDSGRLQQEMLKQRFQELTEKQQQDRETKNAELSLLLQEAEVTLKVNVKEEVERQIEQKIEERLKKELDERMTKITEELRAEMKRDAARASERKMTDDDKETMAERVSELESALRKAQIERGKVKRKFEVRMVRMRQQNADLSQRVQELDKRCRELEAENERLRTLDIVSRTNFLGHGPRLECFSCKQEYTTEHNPANGCRFHPLPSMPYESWRSYISAEELPPNFLVNCGRSYFYYVCCNVLSSRRPEGCCRGKHHQQWEMDIVMRQVLTSGDEHAFSEPLSIL